MSETVASTQEGVTCNDWLGRVRALQADAADLKKFVESLTEAERTGPLRTVNQVIAQAWAMSIQMAAVVLRAERPNDPKLSGGGPQASTNTEGTTPPSAPARG